MIPIEEQLPDIGQKTKCIVNFWRYGTIHHTEEIDAEYIGINKMIGRPMWDIEIYDEAYAEVTHWEPIV